MKEKLLELYNNRLVKSFTVLFMGDGIAAAISLVNMAILIKALGSEVNGIFLMIQTYCLLFNDIFNFQSFNAIIKYLPYHIKKNEKRNIKSYIKQAFILDFVTAIIAFFIGYIFIDVFAKIMLWNNQIKVAISIYLISVLFNISGTALGILRVYGDYKKIATTNVIINLIKLLFYCIGCNLKVGLMTFIILETFTEVIKNILLISMAFTLLKVEGLNDFYKINLRFDREFFKFNIYSNIVSTLDLPIGHITTFIISKYLGFNEITVFKVYQKIGSLIEKVSTPINQIIFPEMSSLVSQKKYNEAFKLNKKLFYLISGVGSCAITFVALSYKAWIFIFIEDYQGVIFTLILYLIITIFSKATLGIHPLFMSLGYIRYNVPIILICNSIYLIILIYLAKEYGLLGVIIARGLQYISVVTIKYIFMRINYKKDYVIS